MTIRFPFTALAVLLFICTTGSATDIAVLRNGFSIRHERREIRGTVTRLYTGAGNASYIDVATDQIARFERDETLVAKPVPAETAGLVGTETRVQSPVGQNVSRLPRPVNLDQVVRDASGKHLVDPDFINSVIRAESGFNTRAVSPKGAQGLMQLMPGTASSLGVTNAFDPHANVDGGTRYLRWLLEKYNYDVPKALAAYNAGPHRVEQYHGVPPYLETRAYVARIIRDFNRKKLAEQKAAAAARKNQAESLRTMTPNPQSPRKNSAGTASGSR